MEPGTVRADDTITRALNWNDYTVFDPGVFGPLSDLPRTEARAAFEHLMQEKSYRIEELRALLAANGIDLRADDQGLRDLAAWLRENVEGSAGEAGRLEDRWYSVVNDIALHLGETIISRAPNLRWEFFTKGKNNAAYQRHVIMGFTQVRNPKYNVDIDAGVAAFAERVLLGMPTDDGEFMEWVERAVADA